MFHKEQNELTQRRQRLLVRSAELRMTLASQAQVLRAPLALVDQVRAGVQWLRHHPQWPLGALLLLVVRRPKRALRWAARLWWGWGLYRRMQQWLGKPPPQRP